MSSNTYRMVNLIVRGSSILVIDMKKVFERSLNHTTRKNRADLLLAIFYFIFIFIFFRSRFFFF